MIELIDTIKKFIKDHIAISIALIIVLTPTIWSIASGYFKGQISTLKEQINLLHEKEKFMELKMMECSQSTYSIQEKSNETSGNDTKVEMHVKGIYPKIENPRELSKVEVAALIDFYELNRDWKIIPI